MLAAPQAAHAMGSRRRSDESVCVKQGITCQHGRSVEGSVEVQRWGSAQRHKQRGRAFAETERGKDHKAAAAANGMGEGVIRITCCT